MKKFSLMVLIVMVLSSCSGRHGSLKENIGSIAGAVGGAWIGSNIGGGSGRVAAIAAGTLLGSALGREVGYSLEGGDLARYHHTSQTALEKGRSGTSLAWTNPDTGHSGTVTPLNVYRNDSGEYCREYTQTIIVGGERQEGYGIACRQPDGKWKIVK